ncbi:hypothetical protein [Cylindrospermopsis curvispora]|nr:hypothetical protein [Cylindrospermopsis curvispora]
MKISENIEKFLVNHPEKPPLGIHSLGHFPPLNYWRSPLLML